MFGAIEVRSKRDSFIGDFAQRGETEYLVAAGVRQNGPLPGHKLVQATELANQFVAGAQIQMISVGENDLNAEFFERFVRQRLDGCSGSHRHECRGFNLSVGSSQESVAGAGCIGLFYFKRKIHLRSLAAAAAKTLPTPLCPRAKRP